MGKITATRKVKIGIIQVNHVIEESREKKYLHLLELAENCFCEGAELVFFPEAYQHTGDRDIIYRKEDLVADALAWRERCAELARKYHAYIVPWEYELSGDTVYNSSYILDREGKEVGRYRKCQITYSETERGIGRGDSFPVFDLDFGKVGIMICFDNYFPESARALGVQGAELVLYPLYGDTLIPQWEMKMRARAMDNSMYIASCQIDMFALAGGVAYSGLIAPDGSVIEKLDKAPSYSVVEIEMGKQVITCTGANGISEDLRRYLEKTRNPKAYSILTKEFETWDWEDIRFKK